MKPINKKLYFVALILTAIIFIAALIVSNYFNKKKTDAVKSEEDQITVSILSSDTQLDLLNTTTTCETFDETALETKLSDLSSRLGYMEQQLGVDNPDVFRLKRYYAILEARAYLLGEKMASECNRKEISILYFYSNKNCPDCDKQQYILQAVHDSYPGIKIYAFDYNLDLASVENFIALPQIPTAAPTIEINGKAYAAFPTLESMESIVDSLLAGSSTSPQATSKK